MVGQISSEVHLTDEELIRLGDDALSLRKRRAARKHLNRCWSCRSRFESLQSTILSIVRHCEILTEQLGSAPNGWIGFERRLEQQVAARPNRSNIFKREIFELSCVRRNRFFSQIAQPRFVISSALVLAVLCAFFSDSFIPSARASQILRQASSRDVQLLSAVADPVIHQRLELTSAGRRAEWDCWRTAVGRDLRSSWVGNTELKQEFLKKYGETDLRSDRLLSPSAFLRWQTSPDIKTVAVHENGGRSVAILCRLDTSANSHRTVIEQASLTLSEPDLHPTNQILQIRTTAGLAEYEIREISYAVLPLAQFRLRELDSQTITHAPRHFQHHVDPAALEEAEAKARILLHENGADLKYAPQITRRSGSVRINVVVDDEQQRNELNNALATLPHVVAHVWTPDTAPAASNDEPKGVDTRQPAEPLHRTEALMGDELVRCLGSTVAANAFVARIHSTMHVAMVPAIALENLANRYPGDSELLSPDARAGIDRIANDYLAALAQYAVRLNADLDPVLRRCLQSQGLPRRAASQAASHATLDWRKSGLAVASYFRRFDSYFNLLFTTQESPAVPVSAAQALAGLAEADIYLEQSVLQAQTSPPEPPSSQKPVH